ncbi:MAG TPA: hypothetical protein VN808_19275 [Stellaceae bacterium]|nr:hypothetical protein [Stellaceae bacterium]
MARPRTDNPAPSTLRSRKSREAAKAKAAELEANRLNPLAEYPVKVDGATISDLIADDAGDDSDFRDTKAGGAALERWVKKVARDRANARAEGDALARRPGLQRRRIDSAEIPSSSVRGKGS